MLTVGQESSDALIPVWANEVYNRQSTLYSSSFFYKLYLSFRLNQWGHLPGGRGFSTSEGLNMPLLGFCSGREHWKLIPRA